MPTPYPQTGATMKKGRKKKERKTRKKKSAPAAPTMVPTPGVTPSF
jgi:hypothetical protein